MEYTALDVLLSFLATVSHLFILPIIGGWILYQVPLLRTLLDTAKAPA